MDFSSMALSFMLTNQFILINQILFSYLDDGKRMELRSEWFGGACNAVIAHLETRSMSLAGLANIDFHGLMRRLRES
jgi:hypothetical protein